MNRLLLIPLVLFLACEDKQEKDCAGIEGGSAKMDSCGICVDGTTGVEACTEDCSGTWGGTAVIDNCDNCVGGDTSEIACTEDCNGDWGGNALLDMCGTCDNDSLNDCTQDCNGDWGGDAVEDCAGVCEGTSQAEDCIVTDIDGNIYQNVQIGNQLWMQETLKVTHYRNGDEISTGYSESEWADLDETETGSYAVYNDDPLNGETHGNLYNWYAVDDVRGVCPEGWHVPTDEEIKQLEMYLGMSQEEADNDGWRGTNEGSKLAVRTDLWDDGNLENNPEFGTSGFNLLPSGSRYFDGNYLYMGSNGSFWSSTEYSSNYAWYRILNYNNSDINRRKIYKQNGFSVRCIKD